MAAPTRVLELRSVRGTGGGPEKTILLGSARTDPTRYAITVCYIRDLRDSIFAIDRRAGEFSLDYVEVTERHSFDLGVWPKLRDLVRDRRIDIVHSHDYKTNLYAYLLAKFEGIIPLATLHGYTGESWKERLYYAADKRLVRRFPRLIAVSGELRHELLRTGSKPERVVRVLNGIDDRAFFQRPELQAEARRALGLDAGDSVLGAVGRAERQKRFDVLLEAFGIVCQRMPQQHLKLVIAGDGSLLESLRAQRAQLGLEDRCVLAGHRSDIALLHHAFDLFVQSSEYEGTPNAVLEAMAFETPIVATDVGGTSELLMNGADGVIVPPGNASLLADAITRTLQNPAEARRRAVSARKRVEADLSFHTRMTKVEAVYDELMATRARQSSKHSANQAASARVR
jgi:glycosyltransferase involved in cell wall biosynthesis